MRRFGEAVQGLVDDYRDDDGEEEEDGLGIVMFEYSVVSWRERGRKQFINQSSQAPIGQLVELFQKGVDRGEFQPLQPLEAIAIMFAIITDGLILYTSIADSERIYLDEQLEGLKMYLRTVLQVEGSREVGETYFTRLLFY